jgi:hypothetical protein
MNRDYIPYIVIAGCVLVTGALLLRSNAPPATPPLPSTEVIVQQLETGKTSEEKVAAVKQLIRHGKKARMQVRKALTVHRNDEPRVIMTLLQATRETRDYRSVPTAIELLEHPDPYVRGQANSAVCKIIGAEFGFQAKVDPKQQTAIIKMMKDDYEAGLPRLQEFYADQKE